MISHQLIDYKRYSLIEREEYFKNIDQSIYKNAVVISTCNRLEIYTGSGFAEPAMVKHLFELASGLQSKLIGETAILGQIKDSYKRASSNQKLDKTLHRMFQHALHVGKKVRSNTAISRGAMSYAQATVQLISTIYADLSGKTITLLGAHSMNDEIVGFLTRKGAKTFLIGNRNILKAKELATKYNAEAFNLSELKERLSITDILITATSAPHTIINQGHITGNNALTIFDLAVPRDVDSTVSDLQNVTVYNIENIEEKITTNILLRTIEADKAKDIINQEVENFLFWQNKQYERTKTTDSDSFAA